MHLSTQRHSPHYATMEVTANICAVILNDAVIKLDDCFEALEGKDGFVRLFSKWSDGRYRFNRLSGTIETERHYGAVEIITYKPEGAD